MNISTKHSTYFKRYFCFAVNIVVFFFRDNENLNTHKEYYNDLPGKLPPELLDAATAMTKQNVTKYIYLRA